VDQHTTTLFRSRGGRLGNGLASANGRSACGKRMAPACRSSFEEKFPGNRSGDVIYPAR